MILDLPVIFTVLMGLAILAYVILDGYDLGVAMLMPAATSGEQERMVASIGPFWDANQTWLVLGVGLLLVAFPAAHGIVMSALYLPVIAMLVGLMLRGVSFEFRLKAEGWHREGTQCRKPYAKLTVGALHCASKPAVTAALDNRGDGGRGCCYWLFSV